MLMVTIIYMKSFCNNALKSRKFSPKYELRFLLKKVREINNSIQFLRGKHITLIVKFLENISVFCTELRGTVHGHEPVYSIRQIWSITSVQ